MLPLLQHREGLQCIALQGEDEDALPTQRATTLALAFIVLEVVVTTKQPNSASVDRREEEATSKLARIGM